MDAIGMGVAITILTVSLYWYTAVKCLRIGAWLFPTVLALDFLIGLAGWPVTFLLWKLCFFYGLARWDSVRGLYRMPRWPRVDQRGRGGRRKREFTEPMPWFRGPGTY